MSEFNKKHRQLRRIIDKHFNLVELQMLAFDLGVDYEHLSGQEKLIKITSMIQYALRHDKFDNLLKLILEERPHIQLPNFEQPDGGFLLTPSPDNTNTRLNPSNDSEILFAKAENNLAKGNIIQALDDINQAIRQNPTNPSYY